MEIHHYSIGCNDIIFMSSERSFIVGVYHSFDFQDFRRDNQGEMFEKY